MHPILAIVAYIIVGGIFLGIVEEIDPTTEQIFPVVIILWPLMAFVLCWYPFYLLSKRVAAGIRRSL